MVEKASGLDMEVQFLKGVGPRNAMLLAKLGIQTVRDALWYLPRRYEDRREIPPLMFLKPGRHGTARGRLIDVDTKRLRGGKVLLQAKIQDKTGQVILQWFNQPWLGKQLQNLVGRDLIAYGLVREGFRSELEMSSPEWEAIEDDEVEEFARIVPVYALSEGVPQRAVRKACRSAAELFADLVPDPLPEDFRKAHKLRKVGWCLRQLHLPETDEARSEGRRRLAFEEFLYLQLALQLRRNEAKQVAGITFPISRLSGQSVSGGTLFAPESAVPAGGSLWDEVAAMLPFELTGAQRRVIDEIWKDMERPQPMNRLVQGDVGSGKTAVAACAMLAAVRCGYQAALMAPTEILAEQHAFNLSRLFDPLGINVNLMVGKLNVKQKRKALEQAANGEAQICVGTHALIQEGVNFLRLGLAVVDEQHRFGVMQRVALRDKSDLNPDVLVMTATPIPRTLTMAIYGDLDLSVIDELPPGRKPVRTHWRRPNERSRVYEGVRKLLDEGRQAYFVCPAIFESEKLQTQAAEDLFYRLSQLEFPDRRVGLLHGQLKPAEKQEVMEAFRAHRLDVLVATVVIEVGVDVPNASVMVIEDANRFGLAQLHQLRGRVGRGDTQSFCVLVADSRSEDTERRLSVLVETTDGFRIAEEDLDIRGPGDMMGTRQHGSLDLQVGDLIKDADLLEKARQAAIDVLENDPQLERPEWSPVVERLRERRAKEALIMVS
ncbi:MAG: ATP-dependent DNA helicase RecG [Fimbriimonadaceae bacterium]|nr:ATP-dependent DNA helicase RecG [Fimbriimonadaceae bacterium]QYK55661.1 MAG: ATP-dependent DNA helicase RecG [Fimbriimonadaceae bacterium]